MNSNGSVKNGRSARVRTVDRSQVSADPGLPVTLHFPSTAFRPSVVKADKPLSALHPVRNSAPSFLPSIRLQPTMVTARNPIAQTPSAAATYLPVY